MTGAIPARVLHREEGALVEWLHLDGAPFVEPFFEETLARLRRLATNEPSRRLLTPIDALLAAAPGLPLAGLIFHVSRCGSTLFAQLLGTCPRHVVVAEPPIIDDILRSVQRDATISDEQRIGWLRGAVAALASRQTGEARRLFVKLDCWAIFDLPLLQSAFPGTPCYFIYRDPLEVLVSLMQMPSIAIVRDTVSPAQLGLGAEERDRLTQEEHAAAVLGAIFRAGCEHRAHLVPVAYPEVAEFVRTRLIDAETREMTAEAFRLRLGRSAKRPSGAFIPDTDEKRRMASPALAAACSRWAEPPYRRWLNASAPG